MPGERGPSAADDGARDDKRDPAGADRVTPLERRSRWLLRAYPAAYRRERGEELIGTLLETTPEAQAWPRLRDVRALATGGLKARAAQNRRFSTAANLRIAVMAGVSFYVVMIAAEYLGVYLRELSADPRPTGSLLSLLVTASLVSTVLLAWIARRAIAAMSGLAAVAVFYFVQRQYLLFWPLAALVLDLAALVLLAPRSTRLQRWWLWLIGAFAVTVLWAAVDPWYSAPGLLRYAPVLAFGVVSIAWIGIDARLAVAVVTFVLTFYVAQMALFFNAGIVPYVLAFVAIAALPVWLTRRQSARRVG
jgi:hypothetical protein